MLQAASAGRWRSRCKPAQRITWNSMGANGHAAGELHSVALFRMAVSKPPMARTLPAGTSCSAYHQYCGQGNQGKRSCTASAARPAA